MYENLTKEDIEKSLKEIFYAPQRNQFKMYTGIGGADKFDEQMQLIGMGMKRFYIGKKPIRILNRLSFKIYKNRLGRYYKLIKA